ncbi:MAG: type II toxin-antitoxin system VapC family toxin [bacterium]|nr:type II toxin-antitoxin system VapC family toxin [bacterium]
MSEGVLLDTSVFLYVIAEPERVPQAFRDVIDKAESRLLSVASLWEIAIKASLSKLSLPEPAGTYVPSRAARLHCSLLPILPEHAGHVQTLPFHHRDPFDRLIIAQARIERLTVLTLDRTFSRYKVRVFQPGVRGAPERR